MVYLSLCLRLKINMGCGLFKFGACEKGERGLSLGVELESDGVWFI